ncbi:peptidylprolyl isomerase [Nocardioides jejuensis]|uniref:Peptidylprolyl isomerase n=1 Tax=Nocardioides jejuensis TaxID=2502782 RepID=A0A4R1C141_9ACTN|nr:peptidylprolyl isomerase [Nocardioides jejuensis]TCJ23395.1 peptidylprolyl isomerase [Nocardioides jejuensis]
MLTRTALAAASLVLIPAAALTACGSDTDAQKAPTSAGDATCSYPSSGQAARDVKAPSSEPTVDNAVSATIKTNVGDLGITLDGKATPCTVNSFLSLAKQGFYDDTSCPRLANTPGFGMLQCGDPTGTTSGGPGYTIPDEITGKETYPAGTIAMANTGQPDSGGSQFFLVFADSSLTPDYTVFGHLDAAAIKILKGVGAKGDDGSNPYGGGKPNQPVTITDVVVS